jgi:hypothetical protein
MPVRGPECHRIFPRFAHSGVKRSANVGIQHCEFELQIFPAGARDPVTFLWIKFRDVDVVHLLIGCQGNSKALFEE